MVDCGVTANDLWPDDHRGSTAGDGGGLLQLWHVDTRPIARLAEFCDGWGGGLGNLWQATLTGARSAAIPPYWAADSA